MQRLIFFAVCAILAFHACGYYAVHGVMMYANDARVEAMRESQNASAQLTRVAIPGGRANAHVRWSDANEFTLDGKLFDIVREETHGDTLIAFCAHDGEEEAIDARIGDHVARTAGDAGSHGMRMLIDLPSPEGTPVAAASIPRAPITERIFAAGAFRISSLEPATFSPPPRG